MAEPALALTPDWPGMLADACAGKGLAAVFQPLVDLRCGDVVGYEGLTRFTVLDGVGPETWFAAARVHGCDAELEAVTLERMLTARRDLPRDTFLSVNVSPATIASSPVAAVLHGERDLHGVVIELTEQTPVPSYADLNRHLTMYRSRGARVAIDDVGAGYAGLKHILELKPAIVKLDRALVSNLDQDQAKCIVVEMLALCATRLGGSIVAEGIETVAELEALRALNVPYGQGWALAAPAAGWPELDARAVAVLRA